MACGEFFVCRTKITAIEVHEHSSNTGIGAVVTDFNQSNKVKTCNAPYTTQANQRCGMTIYLNQLP